MDVDFKTEAHKDFDRYIFDIPHEAIMKVDLPMEEILELVKLSGSELASETAAAVSILTKLIEDWNSIER